MKSKSLQNEFLQTIFSYLAAVYFVRRPSFVLTIQIVELKYDGENYIIKIIIPENENLCLWIVMFNS